MSGASIGILASAIRPGKVGGIEYFLRNLVNGLVPCAELDRLHIYDDPGLCATPSTKVDSMPANRTGLLHRSRFARESIGAHVLGKQCDAILCPDYFTPPGRRKTPLVTVIHDAQYLHFPANFSRQKRLWLQACHRWTLHRADRVIAISEFGRRDLLQRYGSRYERKIVCIPNPVSWARFIAAEEPPASSADLLPYILSVAHQYPHKNLSTLIRAFALVHQTDKTIRLKLVGQAPATFRHARGACDLPALVRELQLENKIDFCGNVDDATLGRLYRAATLFVFPSLFEGFGLPPVEALGLGIPVITTRAASLPEVTLGLASCVDDPLSPQELSDKIQHVLRNPAAFSPAKRDVERIRSRYDPQRIAGCYLSAMCGVRSSQLHPHSLPGPICP
jgi:glycosyltransferase involved in cell wall biosynthesis